MTTPITDLLGQQVETVSAVWKQTLMDSLKSMRLYEDATFFSGGRRSVLDFRVQRIKSDGASDQFIYLPTNLPIPEDWAWDRSVLDQLDAGRAWWEILQVKKLESALEGEDYQMWGTPYPSPDWAKGVQYFQVKNSKSYMGLSRR